MRFFTVIILIGALAVGTFGAAGCSSSSEKENPTAQSEQTDDDKDLGDVFSDIVGSFGDSDDSESSDAEEQTDKEATDTEGQTEEKSSGIFSGIADTVGNVFGGSTEDSAAQQSGTLDTVTGSDKTKALFSKKVDGDTAYFVTDLGNGDEEIKVRFLAVDTPETVKTGVEVQDWGPEASDYTYNRLSSANEIYLEWDNGSDMKDAYDRYLAWVWVDGSLLEEELVSQGLAQVAYIYGDYKYTDQLYEAQSVAQENKVGIWSDE